MKLLKTSIVIAGMALSAAACHKNVTDNNSVNITENATSTDVNATDMNATDVNATMNATDVNATGDNASGNGTRSDQGPRG